MGRIARALFPLVLAGQLAGCAAQSARFSADPPVTDLDDRQPIPVPESWDIDLRSFVANELVRRPLVDNLAVSEPPPAGDVNSRDEVVASTWWTPRLGYRDLSPERLVRGDPAEFLGPPEPPLEIVGAKRGGSDPGFLAKDGRGHKYLVKFDPPDRPDLSTTTALIVNRLFWGFGYNVADDSRIRLRREDLGIAPDLAFSEGDLDSVLARAAGSPEKGWAATASRWIEGKVLGPSRYEGRRPDDPNDRIPVERRRSMRALKVFCTWVNQTGIRPDQTIDTYIGEPGAGYVQHYLVDFGEAFGGHALTHRVLYMWDGYETYIDFGNALENLVTLGLKVHPWENLELSPYRSVGFFEAEIFDPAKWREVYPYEPMRASRPEDDYWAAKIVGAVTREHLEALFDAAAYSEPGAAEYLLGVLVERRRKVLEHFLYEVTPLDWEGLDGSVVTLRDVGRQLCERADVTDEVEIRFLDGDGRAAAPPATVRSTEGAVRVPLPASILELPDGYLRIDARIRLAGGWTPRAAQFHLRRIGGELRLAGVLH